VEGDHELASVNKIIVIGNVGRDPELRYTANGKSMVKFSLATNHRFQDQNGEWQEQTEWFNVIAWNQLAERVMERVQKGSQAYVEGRLQTRTWTGNDGKDRKDVEIVANTILSLDRRGEMVGVPSSGGMRRSNETEIVDPDDLPFD
jgi:single-strand DNA-binding protein